MKARVTAQVSIRADRQTVFMYLSNLRYHHLWNPHLQHITPLEPLKLGMTYQALSLLLGIKVATNNQVTRLVPNEELRLENTTGMLTYTVTYRLRTKQEQTVLICVTEVSAGHVAFAFSAPVLKLLARRELQSDLQALKIAAEQRL